MRTHSKGQAQGVKAPSGLSTHLAVTPRAWVTVFCGLGPRCTRLYDAVRRIRRKWILAPCWGFRRSVPIVAWQRTTMAASTVQGNHLKWIVIFSPSCQPGYGTWNANTSPWFLIYNDEHSIVVTALLSQFKARVSGRQNAQKFVSPRAVAKYLNFLLAREWHDRSRS